MGGPTPDGLLLWATPVRRHVMTQWLAELQP